MENQSRLLREKAEKYLREVIVSGKMKEGDPITEEEIAKCLSISRTPVREALSRLEREGYVVIYPQRGAYVATFSLADVEEIFQIREALESYAAASACTRIPAEVLDDFEARFKVAEGPPVDEAELVRIGYEFHDAILSHSGNHRLMNTITTYRGQIRQVQRITEAVSGKVWSSHLEHRELINILRLRVPQLAEAFMRYHIQSTRDTTIKAMQEFLNGADPSSGEKDSPESSTAS